MIVIREVRDSTARMTPVGNSIDNTIDIENERRTSDVVLVATSNKARAGHGVATYRSCNIIYDGDI